jgi:hypothetical protein
VGSDKDRGFWAIAIGAALVVVAVIYGLRARVADSPVPAAVARFETSSAVGQALAQSPAARPTAERRPQIIASVFECRANGRRVFSDQRCGASTRVRSVAVPNRMDPQDTGSLREPMSVPAPAHPQYGAAVNAGNQEECADIEREQGAINAHMREGYGAAEGEFLRDRLRTLSNMYHALHCRHFH